MRVVVESPLRGKTPEETRENYRYLLWCLRAVYLAGYRPIASHPICPWFMDDSDAKERADGIDWPWMWEPGVVHVFFVDKGHSDGMRKSSERCRLLGIPAMQANLFLYENGEWDAYQRGEWPPHTEGFELR